MANDKCGENIMKPSMTKGWFAVIAALGLVLITGCATYYKVKDPQTGNVYYTEKVDYISGGAVRMFDARTGSMVTIQNSEVKEIGSDEFQKGLAAPMSKPTQTAPAPAPATAPAAAPAPATTEAPKSAPSGT